MKKSLIALVLACAAVSATAQARPNDVLTTSQVEVFYGDLNLNNPAGAQMMLGRIKQAAIRVCGGSKPSIHDMRDRRTFRDCVERATNDAVRQLNAPLVTALHTGRPADPRVAVR
jgi:UrcA family protein